MESQHGIPIECKIYHEPPNDWLQEVLEPCVNVYSESCYLDVLPDNGNISPR